MAEICNNVHTSYILAFSVYAVLYLMFTLLCLVVFQYLLIIYTRLPCFVNFIPCYQLVFISLIVLLLIFGCTVWKVISVIAELHLQQSVCCTPCQVAIELQTLKSAVFLSIYIYQGTIVSYM